MQERDNGPTLADGQGMDLGRANFEIDREVLELGKRLGYPRIDMEVYAVELRKMFDAWVERTQGLTDEPEAFVLGAMDGCVEPPESILGFDRDGLDLLPTLGQLASIKPPTTEALLEPLVHPDDFGMIYGDPGSGKTMLGLVLGASLASGVPVGGFNPRRAEEVLYIDGEMSPKHWEARQKTFAAAGLPLDPLRVASRKWKPDTLPAWDVTDERFSNHVVHRVAGWGVRLVILDSMSAVHPDADENDPRSVAPFNRLAVWLAQRGCALILIHHSNLAGRPSGTLARMRQLDWAVRVKARTVRPWGVSLAFTKNRGLAGLPAHTLGLRKGPEGLSFASKPTALKEGRETRLAEAVKAKLEDPEKSFGELSREFDVPKTTLQRKFKKESQKS